MVFTNIKIFNTSILYDKRIVPVHINDLKQIVLKYNQNDISIEFAGLNFINPQKNTYKYQLVGFDRDWINNGTSNEVKYTNLDPGNYVFKVMAANNDGVWGDSERSLVIRIKPPWWSTLIFRIFIVALIIGIVILLITIRTHNLKQQREKLIRMVNERTSEIEKQQKELLKQSQELLKTNDLLIEKQEKIQYQKEAIEKQNLKLEHKNALLEDQKNEILLQKAEVERMAVKLHESDQMKLKFFTNISHEFRTPLSLILMPLENILKTGFSKEINNAFKNLNVIYRNAVRLQRLINQFLDLSKIENGVLKLHVNEGDINKYIQGIVEAYNYIAEQKNIDLSFHSEVNGKCFFDADKIEKFYIIYFPMHLNLPFRVVSYQFE
ncbi:MAG: hypothetical protein HC906_03165 [Bacteroidales bacterium]|nr:hypothetical protein [Bacteroidales bacterium]